MKFFSNFRLLKRRPKESEIVRALTTLTLAMRNDPELRRSTRQRIASAIYRRGAAIKFSEDAADRVMQDIFSIESENKL